MTKQFILIVAIISTIMISCKEPVEIEPELLVNTTEFAFDSLGGDQILVIESNISWKLSFSEDWVSSTTLADSGDYTLTITAEETDTCVVREAILTISAEDIDSVEIAIIQEGKDAIADGNGDTPVIVDPELTVNTTEFEFDSLGGDQTLVIESNVSWEVSFSEDWVSSTTLADSGNYNLIVTVEETDTTVTREATLTISAADLEPVNISIIQTGKTPPKVDLVALYPDMQDINTVELAKDMGLGWNLGNSLESLYTDGSGNLVGNETSWGNPTITQGLIDAVKAAGFNAVRIPVSWSHQMESGQYGDYTIKESWLKRIEEVVNYVLNDDMYAIINVHWDGGWMNEPDYNHQDEINEKLEAIWTQVASYFQDYGDHLLFAGSNEVHVENVYTTPTAENRTVQNSFNQTFVTTVRNTGGRNLVRHLIIPGYNTNIDYARRFLTMPTDTIENRLMVEVHYYDPYGFALQENGGVTQWGEGFDDVSSWGQEDWVETAFGYMKSRFIDNNIGVLLGEYGAILRTELDDDEEALHIAARNYYLKYITTSAYNKGIAPVYWDNGYVENNGFGLFNRSTGEQVYPDAIQAIMSALE